ncbi:sortase [Bacillus bombysepticus]|uniref:sortase n=1 Tax=Bacillus bombysepticus TaxID=658666 RepID=UPI003016E7C4
MKFTLRKLLCLLCFVGGFICLHQPFLQYNHYKDTQEDLHLAWEKYVHGKMKKPIFQNQTIEGRLIIPKIDLDMVVLKDATEENLNISLSTTLSNNKNEIGEGNFAIAGHRTLKSGMYFSDLPKLEEGDQIRYLNKGFVYTFTITSHKIVSPESIDVLEYHGYPELTLITCTPQILYNKRWIVFAKLDSIKKAVKN